MSTEKRIWCTLLNLNEPDLAAGSWRLLFPAQPRIVNYNQTKIAFRIPLYFFNIKYQTVSLSTVNWVSAKPR